MDKVKAFLKLAKRQHFWVICVLVAGIAGYCWYAAVSTMATELSKYKGEITQREKTAEDIGGIKDHPNPEWHKGQEKLIEDRRESVRVAWDAQYKRQGDVLKWPSSLSADFVKSVEKLRPIEEKLAQKEFKEIFPHLRDQYRDFIKTELPKLAERNGCDWTAPLEVSAGGGVGGDFGRNPVGPGPNVEGALAGPGSKEAKDKAKNKQLLVAWDQADQSRWLADHFDWSKESDKRPKTKQILYAQEDLWVLDAVLRVVKRVNGDVDERHPPKISAINFIKTGKDARALLGQVTMLGEGAGAGMGANGGPNAMNPGAGPVAPAMGPGAAGAPAAAMQRPVEGRPGMAGPAGPMSSGQPGVPGAAGAAGALVDDPTDPAHERYVDENYKPIAASRLKSIGATKDQSDAHLAVAKRIPVRMRVRMDVRATPKLLAECANADMTIEVRQIRLNPRDDGGGGNAGGGMGAFGGGEGGRMGPMPVGGGARNGDSKGAGTSDNTGIVEIYGIVYVYNPVNYAKLGLDETKYDPDAAKTDGKVDATKATDPKGAAPGAKPAGPAAGGTTEKKVDGSVAGKADGEGGAAAKTTSPESAVKTDSKGPEAKEPADKGGAKSPAAVEGAKKAVGPVGDKGN